MKDETEEPPFDLRELAKRSTLRVFKLFSHVPIVALDIMTNAFCQVHHRRFRLAS